MTRSARSTSSFSLLRASSTVGVMTLCSRLLGFWRDMVLAQIFGAGLAIDAFLVAFKIPNFLRRMFAEGAFSQAFVPVLSEYQEAQDPQALKAYVDGVAGTLSLVLFVLCLVAMLAAPWVVRAFAPGFGASDPRLPLATEMLRITFPYLGFIALTALSAGILNSHRQFVLPALTPTLLNFCLVGAAYWGGRLCEVPEVALAWGVLVSGVLQWLIQGPALKKLGMLPRFRIDFRHPGVRKTIVLMGPIILGSSVSQINLMMDTIFASFLEVGSVSWLYFSDRLVWFPLGIFGVAIATVVLPHLSRTRWSKPEAYRAALDWAIRANLWIGIPSALALYVLAEPIFFTLFFSGKFTLHDVEMASKSLKAFAIGLPAFMLSKIVTTAFYAIQDVKTPVRWAIISVLCNFLLNLLLIRFLAHVGLALSIALASWVQVVGLLTVLWRRQIYRPAAHLWFPFVWRVVLVNALMTLGLLAYSGSLEFWTAQTRMGRFFHLAVLMVVGVIFYGAALGLLRFPFRQLMRPEDSSV